jgi:hypothetical protein
MRSNQINYTINGTDNNDLYLNADAVNQGGISGIAGVIYPIDALDEYSLQTTGNSESGRSPGGNLNVTTKSGTNQFHGDAYYYNRNEALAVSLAVLLAPGSPSSRCATRTMAARSAGPSGTTTPSSSSLRGAEVRHRRGQYRHRALAGLPGARGARGADTNTASYAQPGLAGHPQHAVGSERHCQSSRVTPGNYSSSAPQSGYSHNVVAHLDHNFSDKSHLSAIWYFGQGYADAPDCVFVCGYLPEYFQTVPSHIQNFNVSGTTALRPNLTNQLAAGVSFFTQAFADAVHTRIP